MKERCNDILMSVSWLDFSNRYFQRSSSWFTTKWTELTATVALVVSLLKN